MSFDEKKVAIEHLEREQTTSDDLVELSGIEATATSKAAWLIAITVSIGGFLFGQ
jgi:MFS transporter, SP family, solute carrier family 2 (myo-inositol transporter), member 13